MTGVCSNQSAMDLELDRKEMVLISVIILMILAWAIGNLGGAYFGMEDEKIDREPGRAEGTAGGSPLGIPDFLEGYAGNVFFVIVMLGFGGWFLFSDEGWKSKSIRGGAFLAVISLIYFSDYFLPKIFSISSRFEDVLPDIEYPSISDIVFGSNSQSIFSSAKSSIGILILLSSILALIFFYIRHKNLSEQSSETEENISSTADRAITELHEGEDVRDIIIRNYQKMLIVLEKEGVKQEISFTPRELEKMALSRLQLSEGTIDEMTRLFEEAKYSDHPLGEKERRRAIDNFKQIKDELKGMKNA